MNIDNDGKEIAKSITNLIAKASAEARERQNTRERNRTTSNNTTF